MPELPDLTVVAEELVRRVAGRTVREATAPTPILLRSTPDELDRRAGRLDARRTSTSTRQVPAIPLERADGEHRPGREAIWPAASGWFPGSGDDARPGLRLRLEGGEELRYVDRERCSAASTVWPGTTHEIPGWSEMGPDAMTRTDAASASTNAIRRHPGESQTAAPQQPIHRRHRQRL